MAYFRAGVASHSNQWLSAVGPFATAPKPNTPRTLFVSALALAFLTKQDLAAAQCESQRARARRLSTPVDSLRVPGLDLPHNQLPGKLMTPDMSIDGCYYDYGQMNIFFLARKNCWR